MTATAQGQRFELANQQLSQALKLVSGVVESSQVMQVLANVHFSLDQTRLTLTTSNSEMEVVTEVATTTQETCCFTVSARKLLDITRALSDDATIELCYQGQWLHVRAGSSVFKLATLPAESFPFFQDEVDAKVSALPASQLLRHLVKTGFSMARQDVRVFLNGVFLSLSEEGLVTVSSDGHRLSYMKSDAAHEAHGVMIIPRRTVQELVRLLTGMGDAPIQLSFTDRVAVFSAETFTLRTHLIDGQYPPYQKLIPQHLPHQMSLPTLQLKQILQRVGICANEKFRGVRFDIKSGQLDISAHNFEQEVAKEQLPITYAAEDVNISFNMQYLQDVIGILDTESLSFSFNQSDASVLIEPVSDEQIKYVVMPLTLTS